MVSVPRRTQLALRYFLATLFCAGGGAAVANGVDVLTASDGPDFPTQALGAFASVPAATTCFLAAITSFTAKRRWIAPTVISLLVTVGYPLLAVLVTMIWF